MAIGRAKPGGGALDGGVKPLNAAISREERQFFDSRRARRRAGQAAIEYILLAAISTLIFGAMFYAIRKSVFRLWICEITPRVQAPTGCSSRDDCYRKGVEADNIPAACAQALQ